MSKAYNAYEKIADGLGDWIDTALEDGFLDNPVESSHARELIQMADMMAEIEGKQQNTSGQDGELLRSKDRSPHPHRRPRSLRCRHRAGKAGGRKLRLSKGCKAIPRRRRLGRFRVCRLRHS